MRSSDERFQGEDERSHQREDLRSTEERLLAEPIVSDNFIHGSAWTTGTPAAPTGFLTVPCFFSSLVPGGFFFGHSRAKCPFLSHTKQLPGGMRSSDERFQGEDERSHQREDLRSTEERLLAEPIVSDIGLSDKEMVGEAKTAISGGMMSSDERF